ncbi:MAG: DUF11 domain-containing protein, partial [Methanothrix sp.]|nr:DUF11 domain-containing protein [Methanothrix sp.]
MDSATPCINVSKTINVSSGIANTCVNFTIVVSNTGYVALDRVIVTDTLPDGLDEPAPSSGGIVYDDVITWNLGRLEVGENRTLWLSAHIDGSKIGDLENVVSVKGDSESGDNVTAEDSANVTALMANIAVNKTVDKTVAKKGETVNFTIVVNNTGNATLDPVIVTDTLPFCFEYNRSVPAGDHFGGVVTWDLGRLNVSDSRIIYLEANVECLEAGVFANLVEVEGKPEQGDNVTANDTADVSIVRNLTLTKEVDKYDVKRGGEVTYTITVCNHGAEPERNVTVWDVFNRNDVVILSMTPAPDPDGKWRLGTLQPGECRDIIIKIRVPERQDFEFGMEQGVSGEGFVKVANDYSTTFQEYLLKNCAYATSDNYRTPISDCVTVTVRELGTELSTREYGSGYFDVEERVKIFTENKSIEWEEDLSAAYKPTSIVLYHNRTVDYDAAWVKKSRAKNYVTGTTMTETYHDAVGLDRESRIFLDENESVMEVNSDFDGRGHIGFLKMPTNTSPRQATPIFEMREDYVGSFRVLERIDEYGSSVSSEKAASGRGLVVVDKRVGSAQRTYESGTGTYDSEEIIETYTNYIAKDISLVHAPISQRLTESTSIDASMKWKEGMSSTNPQTSYIGEEYTSITELDKETVARGLNDMETDAKFSGQARFRAILDTSQDGRDPEVDFDEQYAGDYSIQRRVHFSGVAKYDRPHLNVTKTLNRIYVETLPWDYGEPHLEGAIKTRRVADYTIRIENDGNRVLQPVYVQDRFPPGATFIEPSSIRPSELTDSYANWTLTHLSIGGAVNISLSLDVSKYYSAGYPPELVNRVEACGVYDDEQVCASNFSALEIKGLTCCLDEPVAVAKTAEIDPANPRVVRYRINLSNNDDAIRVATVTDWLPAGMSLIEASIPVASYEDGVVVWNLLEIDPGETKTIEFSALASADGKFTNVVEVDPRSVEGTVVGPVRATCVIDVGVVEGECDPIGCGIWQPPNWEFQHAGYEPDVMDCELLTAAGCNGTGGCPIC